MNYQLAIADDHQIFRMGLKSILSKYNNIEVVFEAQDGDELLEFLESNKVDLILLDLKMPNKSGYETLKKLRIKDKTVRVIVLSMHGEEIYVNQMMKAKANAYLLKNGDPDEIYIAIISCMQNGSYINNKRAETWSFNYTLSI
jgi:DNA-binding NarL/FixJ family response regulator